MKKVLFILSALLFITGCKVESSSNISPNVPLENDRYSDGIYLFFADINTTKLYPNFEKLRVDYTYQINSLENTDSYFINLKETSFSDIFKIDIENVKLVRVYYQMKSDDDTSYQTGGYGTLDRDILSKLDNGLYAAEFFWENFSNVFLRKTYSKEYYMKYENFYNNKDVLFIKNTHQKERLVYYQKIEGDTFPVGKPIQFKDNELKSIILFETGKRDVVSKDGEHFQIDCSTLIYQNGGVLSLPQLGRGYYYTEIKDGQFTTPVKLNSYKDILEN